MKRAFRYLLVNAAVCLAMSSSTPRLFAQAAPPSPGRPHPQPLSSAP